VHTDARGYLRAIADNDDERAYLIARGPNPLASICGRVCAAPCESSCRRIDYDQPLAIRALKRFVCDRHGSFSGAHGGKEHFEFLTKTAGKFSPYQCQGREEFLPFMQSLIRGDIPKIEGKSVGIIGGGPAGLAAAHDLALMGFSVTVYDMESMLGGMLSVGIPEYRLPRDLIKAEVEVILSLGVIATTNCTVGEDVTFQELREKHDAVVVAVGAKKSRKLPVPGGDAVGVLGGVEFLRDVALGKATPLGRKVVVVGGGAVAMDSARTAVRVEDEQDEASLEQYVMTDMARTASRLGERETVVVYRRSREEMPVHLAEIMEAEEEGVDFHLLTNPVSIEKDDNGRLKGITCRKMKLGEPDESGRRRPVPIEGSDYFMECDNVLLAIGQDIDISFIDSKQDGIKLSEHGQIECDNITGETSCPDVFVAGDLAHGTKLLIDAVASGKSVARSIYRQVTGKMVLANDMELHVPIADYSREAGYEMRPRKDPSCMPADGRATVMCECVEEGFSTEEAVCEAARCLDCGINTIFDGEKCILCGGCADVCPEKCLKLVPVAMLKGGADLKKLVDNYLDDCPIDEASAIIKDETRCIRCGLCSERCPVGAITMEAFNFKEVLIDEG
jgi:NADPH-dependent glutamate synthase beta subunit-like oxidoreductase/ferredoxin